jgi:hypothetical protein
MALLLITQMQKKCTGNEMALKTLQTYFYTIYPFMGNGQL